MADLKISSVIPIGRRIKVVKVAQMHGTESKINVGEVFSGFTKAPAKLNQKLELDNGFKTTEIQNIGQTKDYRFLIKTQTSIYLAEYI